MSVTSRLSLLGPSRADTHTGPMEAPERWLLWLFGLWLLMALAGTLIASYAHDEAYRSIFAIPEKAKFARFGLIVLATILLYVPLGLAVEKRGLNVAFTRKTGHIIGVFILPLISVPVMMDDGDLYREWYQTMVWQSIAIVVLPYSFFIRPIRSRIRIFYYCMRAIDRPEDRPYTLLWFCSQILATSVILVPMTQYFVHLNLWSLYLIPAMACGLGDGLAEPIGKMFGRRGYVARGFLTHRRYRRTYLGSACVGFFAALGVFLNIHVLSAEQFIFLIATVPVAMMITEALSPHTWDNWFMYMVCLALICIALN